MKILTFFLLSSILLFTACGGGSSSVKSDSDSSQFLSVAYAPAANALPISIEKIVTVTFSAAIDSSTVDEMAVYIEDVNKNHIAASLRVLEDKITIIPTAYFSENSSYTLVVTAAVADVDGRTLQDDFIFTFTTSTGPDVSAPSLVLYSPELDTSVDPNSHVIMEFDEMIVADDIGLLELRDSDTDVPVEGITIVSDHEIRFIPIDLLEHEGNYTASLLGTVEDVVGNEYDREVSTWDFSIDPFIDTTASTLLSVTPYPGVSAEIDSTILIEFDERIDASGVVMELNNSVSSSSSIINTFAYTMSGTALSFDPGGLDYDGNYTATLLGPVSDLTGNEYNSTVTWDFLSKPFTDGTAPELLSLTPNAGALEDKVTEIIIAFNETISGGSLELKDSDTDDSLSGTSSIIDNTIHFVPDSNLTEDGNYTVTLQGSVKDLTDNTYTGLTTWDFTVGTLDVLSVHRDDYSQSTNTITIVFSDDLDLSTVSVDDFEVKLWNSYPLTDPTVSNYTEADRVVSFEVDLQLPDNAGYSITISGDIKNLDGSSHNHGNEKTYWFGDGN